MEPASPGSQAANEAPAETGPTEALFETLNFGAIRYLLRNLFDLQLREIITTRMLPLIYFFLITVDAIVVSGCTVSAFLHSLLDGLVWLLLVGPVLFFTALIFIRIVLELVMAAFRIAVCVEIVEAATQNIAGRTEVLEGLPRITFWRGFRGRPGRSAAP